MRIWTVHPQYLDAKGLTALWRESLLARKVLSGKTEGYRNHPQLHRFKNTQTPVACLDNYLRVVLEESLRRGYLFDNSKIGSRREYARIKTTEGQLKYEWEHLREKLKNRNNAAYEKIRGISTPEAHPLFEIISGPVEPWERTK